LKKTVLKGTKNVAANALSHSGILNNPMDEERFSEALCSEPYAMMNICLNQLFLSLMHFLGKHNLQMLQSLKKQLKQNLFKRTHLL
jgi:hypothetical protein